MSTCGNENLPTIHKRTYKPMLKDTKYVKARMGDKSERELTVDQMGRKNVPLSLPLIFWPSKTPFQ